MDASYRSRASADATALELSRNLASWFPDGTARISAVGESFPEFVFGGNQRPTRPLWNPLSNTLTAPILNHDAVVAAVRLQFQRQLTDADIGVAGALVRVFNHDVATAPLMEPHEELWLSLQQTRFTRAIARFAPFHTRYFLRWLRQIENASTLRYENKAFAATILLTKQIRWVTDSGGLACVRFPENLPAERALFSEKWLRGLIHSRDVGLVALGHGMGFWGVFSVRSESEGSTLYPPHQSLSGLCSAVIPGTMAITMSPFGDYYVMFPNGSIFFKTQGRWFYLDVLNIRASLETSLTEQLSGAVLRMALDLSYERKGALLVVLGGREDANKLVADHQSPQQSNHPLRAFGAKLNLLNPAHREILKDIATVDGAVLLSMNGKILDAGCMIGDPPRQEVEAMGLELRKFPGARTTAAWNASLYGTAVKVSEDGPIEVFRQGIRVARIG